MTNSCTKEKYKRVVGLDGMSLKNCLKIIKHSWWDIAKLVTSSLQHFLLGPDTFSVEPVEISWVPKGLVEVTTVVLATYYEDEQREHIHLKVVPVDAGGHPASRPWVWD